MKIFSKRFSTGDFSYDVPIEIQVALLVLSGRIEKVQKDISMPDIDFEFLFKWLSLNELTLVFLSKVKDRDIFPESFIAKLKNEIIIHQGCLSVLNEAGLFLKGYFSSIDIPAVFFKGIDFTHRYYDDPFQRRMCDIDVMVERKNLQKVINSMKSDSGFELRSLNTYLKHHHHFQAILRNFGDLIVEIHWKRPETWVNYTADFARDKETGILIFESGEFKYTGEMNLCLASLSSFSHLESFFKHLHDAFLIISKNEINPDRLFEISSSLGMNKRLRRLLVFLDFYYPGILPSKFLKRGMSTGEKMMIAIIQDFSVKFKRVGLLSSFLYRYFIFENFWKYSERFLKVACFKMRYMLRKYLP